MYWEISTVGGITINTLAQGINKIIGVSRGKRRCNMEDMAWGQGKLRQCDVSKKVPSNKVLLVHGVPLIGIPIEHGIMPHGDNG